MNDEIWLPVLLQVPSVGLYALGALALEGWGPKVMAFVRVAGFVGASVVLGAAVVLAYPVDIRLGLAVLVAAHPLSLVVAGALALTRRTVARILGALVGGLATLCVTGAGVAWITLAFNWRGFAPSTHDLLIFGSAAAMLAAYALEATLGLMWLVGGVLERGEKPTDR